MNAASRAASISVTIALMLAAVWLFWPSALGGGTTYVSTHGISMEPQFHTGDLAILRPDLSYSVGDVVAYRSDSLDTIVMHRIVSVDGDRFVIQGDNNTWLDGDKPSEDEILGKLFIRIPRGGKALAALQSPGPLAVVGIAVLAVIGAARAPRGRGSARPSRHDAQSSRRRTAHRSSAFSMPIRARARQIALGSGAVALLAAVGGGVLLAIPSTQTDSRTLQVTQQGQFSYTGAAQAGTTYPSGVIVTGDPVYTRLTDGLTVSFQDTFSGPGVESLVGTVWLELSVATPDGWTAALGRGPTGVVQDGVVSASAMVDPATATAFLDQHFDEIGANAGGATLVVTPTVAVTGTVEGQVFTAGPLAGLAFSIDATALRVAGDAAAALVPTAQTEVVIDEVGPRSFPVLSVSIPIDVARIIAGVVLAVALVGLAAGAWIGRPRRGDAADDFLVRHAARILPVDAFTPGQTVVDVSDAESLHRVAERLDGLVLHHAGPDGQTLAVRDSDTTYRYVFPDSLSQRPKPPLRAVSPATPHTTPLARTA
jgi:signal peptidase I